MQQKKEQKQEGQDEVFSKMRFWKNGDDNLNLCTFYQKLKAKLESNSFPLPPVTGQSTAIPWSYSVPPYCSGPSGIPPAPWMFPPPMINQFLPPGFQVPPSSYQYPPSQGHNFADATERNMQFPQQSPHASQHFFGGGWPGSVPLVNQGLAHSPLPGYGSTLVTEQDFGRMQQTPYVHEMKQESSPQGPYLPPSFFSPNSSFQAPAPLQSGEEGKMKKPVEKGVAPPCIPKVQRSSSEVETLGLKCADPCLRNVDGVKKRKRDAKPSLSKPAMADSVTNTSSSPSGIGSTAAAAARKRRIEDMKEKKQRCQVRS